MQPIRLGSTPKAQTDPTASTTPAVPKLVLLTGFEPFGGETLNPSELAVRALDGQILAGRRVVGAVLPCVFGAAGTRLLELIKTHRPELVVCVGQAGGRAEISLERVAINVDDATQPDNAGACPSDRPIVPDGPTAYWTTLPIKALVTALHAVGLPAKVSQTAGTFVCNHLFYCLMHALRNRPEVRGGFVHVPFLPEQATRLPGNPPSLTLPQIIRALEIIIVTTAPGPLQVDGIRE